MMAVAPALFGVAMPPTVLEQGAVAPALALQMAATAGLLEVQVTAAMGVAVPAGVYDALVMFTVAPVAVVPMAMKLTLALAPVVSDVCEPGSTASETRGSEEPEPVAVTVMVAVAVTTLLSGLEAIAVRTAVPALFPVTNPPQPVAGVAQLDPPAVMLATDLLLEAHVTVLELVRFCVPGVEAVDEKAPIAMSWLDCPCRTD